MQVGGIGNGSSWEYKYKSATEAGAGAFGTDFLNKTAQAERTDVREDAIGLIGGVEGSDEDSFQSKIEKISEDEKYLAMLKEEDIDRYNAVMAQRREGINMPFRDIEAMAKDAAGSGNVGSANYHGVEITFDFFYKTMSIGDMSGDNVINVGALSNGYSFSFNRDNLDSVIAVLDIFSPEDINKIMEAIVKDDMKNSMEREIDETTAQAGQMGEEGASVSQEAEAGQDALQQTKEEEAQLGEMAQQSNIEDLFRDKADKISGAEGAGTSGKEEGNEEEKKTVTSEIVVNSDGTRNLIIKTKIGDNEIITKMPLSPLREHSEFHRQKGVEAYEENMFTGVGIGDLDSNLAIAE